MLRRALALLLALAAGLAAGARADVAVPALTARVTDLTGTLSAAQQGALERKLAAFEAQKGAQIAVLLVPTTRPETIEQYSLRVVEQWKIGRKNVDDGVLLIVAKNDRQLRIEVGYGLEGAIPDALAKRVIDETIVPRFRAGDYAGGVDAGAEALMRLVRGEPLPAPERAQRRQDGIPSGIFFALVIALLLGSLLIGMLGRVLGSAVTGAAAGVAAGFAYGLLGGVIVGVMAFVFLLAGGARRFYSAGGGGLGGWSGGSGGSGWSGGGGGFGGGGASGRW